MKTSRFTESQIIGILKQADVLARIATRADRGYPLGVESCHGPLPAMTTTNQPPKLAAMIFQSGAI
ncbi:hypothetical protein KPB05_12890 [Burkholderia gladioli]|uniref:hypothetical protein n=1 Tax=Burkholderia gladioli TaxID=28095 RepID=UPI00285F102F|nr:hypothetical protein [Burkholderia gladioli]MDR8088351.1 hypothetical protein [Burkholderia gladioli]